MDLSGAVPSTLGLQSKNLKFVNLVGNRLQGSLPCGILSTDPSFVDRTISLENNQLSGSLPRCDVSGRKPSLFALSPSNNLLTGSTINPYSGSSDLSRTTLFLYGNRFTGAVNASSLSGVQQLGNVYLFGYIPGQEVRLASGIANRMI